MATCSLCKKPFCHRHSAAYHQRQGHERRTILSYDPSKLCWECGATGGWFHDNVMFLVISFVSMVVILVYYSS